MTSENITNYRRDQLALFEQYNNINSNQLFYYLEFTNPQVLSKILSGEALSIQQLSTGCSCLKQNCSQYRFETVLLNQIKEQYIAGAFQEVMPVRVYHFFDSDTIYYPFNLVATSSYQSVYSKSENKQYYCFDHLLNLPDELCAVELFQKQAWDQLMDHNLYCRLPFERYHLEQVAEYHAELLDCSLMESVNKTISQTEKILTKFKKYR